MGIVPKNITAKCEFCTKVNITFKISATFKKSASGSSEFVMG